MPAGESSNPLIAGSLGGLGGPSVPWNYLTIKHPVWLHKAQSLEILPRLGQRRKQGKRGKNGLVTRDNAWARSQKLCLPDGPKDEGKRDIVHTWRNMEVRITKGIQREP